MTPSVGHVELTRHLYLLEIAFRGQTKTVRAGLAINIPANAAHMFKNKSAKTFLLRCTPPIGEEYPHQEPAHE